MATKIKHHKPTTFSEVMNVVEEFQENHQVAWYRGCGDDSFTLEPTLYRHPDKKTPEELGIIPLRQLALTVV